MRTASWVTRVTRLPAVVFLCLPVLISSLSHSLQDGQENPGRRRVQAQQIHPLEHLVPDSTPIYVRTQSSPSSSPWLLTALPLQQLLKRHSGTPNQKHNHKGKKIQRQDRKKNNGRGSKTDRECPKSRSNSSKKSREKASLAHSSPAKPKMDTKRAARKEHGSTTKKHEKLDGVKKTLESNKKLASPELQQTHSKKDGKSFRQSTFRRHGKQYLFTHEDWYTQYRRNRAGPSSVMRKLTLESNRRRKAMVTIEPVVPVNGDSIGSIEQEYGSANALPGSLRGNADINGEDGAGEDEGHDGDDAEDSGDSETGVSNSRTTEIQAVKRPKSVTVGLAPRPIIVRPAGLIPKTRSNKGRSTGVRGIRSTVAVAMTLALLSSLPFL